MASGYVILGKTIPSHWLAIGTILGVVGGVTIPKALNGPAPVAATPAPAKTEESEFDVEKLLNDFLATDEKK
ncbi:hypothetical protein CANARDRAFT_176629 [[Candida] arabinofermentans NRRL YB-2248]|uniref:ATP synthase subunit K, mitochondrial n=1 Tax=[Candida] arabinofermentans NRRL YB-2248 TaxID=983967 RepID=A0A1E4SZB9_9ASCO|nr:hypothetical protein CANARDRAFT_176629 [[Candida] arabinofermentans NRRL YB-2248]